VEAGTDDGKEVSIRRPVNDAWIAARRLVHLLPLGTFNTKDFADFAQHEGLELLRVS
jgi:predicted nucleic acid-binding protein